MMGVRKEANVKLPQDREATPAAFYQFNFPKIVNCEQLVIQEQLSHISEEVGECIAAFYDHDEHGMLVEALDVIHAVETLLRMRVKSEEELKHLKLEVWGKNAIRGYYGEQ